MPNGNGILTNLLIVHGMVLDHVPYSYQQLTIYGLVRFLRVRDKL